MKDLKNMKDLVMGKLLMAQLRAKDYVREVLTNEEGDTNFVSIVLIIVIVVAVAAIFKKQLEGIVVEAFKKVTEFVKK